MKAFYTALFALMLTACSSFSPMTRSVTVYPAEQGTVVGQVADVTAPVEQEVIAVEAVEDATVNLPPKMSPLDEFLASQTFEVDPVVPPSVVWLDPKEVRCMALNMYHEARGEGRNGMLGVGYVVMNRMASPKFRASSACGVVYASGVSKKTGKRVCQFSWTCDGKSDAVTETEMYAKIEEMAREVMLRRAHNPVGNSTHFVERNHPRPNWAVPANFIARIGNHMFYRA